MRLLGNLMMFKNHLIKNKTSKSLFVIDREQVIKLVL